MLCKHRGCLHAWIRRRIAQVFKVLCCLVWENSSRRRASCMWLLSCQYVLNCEWYHGAVAHIHTPFTTAPNCSEWQQRKTNKPGTSHYVGWRTVFPPVKQLLREHKVFSRYFKLGQPLLPLERLITRH